MFGALALTFLLNSPFNKVDPGQTTVLYGTVANGNLPAHDALLHLEFAAALKLDSFSADGWNCITTTTTADCSAQIVAPFAYQQFHFNFVTPSDPKGGAFPIDIALSSTDDPSVQRARLLTLVTRHFAVRSAADSGPETLRAAIDDANAQCAALQQDCAIDFDPGQTDFEPLTPLPDITATSLTIAGKVTIDGTRVRSGNGLTLRPSNARYGGVTITGLTLRGFPGNGIDVAGDRIDAAPLAVDRCTIDDNGLRGISVNSAAVSVEVSGSTIEHNARSGIALWTASGGSIRDNTIRRNGAAGVYIRNVPQAIDVSRGLIAFNETGVAIDPGVAFAAVHADIAENTSADVDWGLDGNNGPEIESGPVIPVLLTAEYDASANLTRITGELRRSTNGAYVALAVYASDHVTRWGTTPMTNMSPVFSQFVRTFGNDDIVTPFTISVAGDYRGAYLSAQSSVQPFLDFPIVSTSELSRAIYVAK